MGNRGIPGYHGRYTVSEFALVKGELLRKYKNMFSASNLDQVCRWVAKHSWQNVRNEAYTQAVEAPGYGAAEASVRMLLVYDEAQRLFDLYHHGESFSRKYQALPERVQKFLENISHDDDSEGHRDNQADRGIRAGAGEAAQA